MSRAFPAGAPAPAAPRPARCPAAPRLAPAIRDRRRLSRRLCPPPPRSPLPRRRRAASSPAAAARARARARRRPARPRHRARCRLGRRRRVRRLRRDVRPTGRLRVRDGRPRPRFVTPESPRPRPRRRPRARRRHGTQPPRVRRLEALDPHCGGHLARHARGGGEARGDLTSVRAATRRRQRDDHPLAAPGTPASPSRSCHDASRLWPGRPRLRRRRSACA